MTMLVSETVPHGFIVIPELNAILRQNTATRAARGAGDGKVRQCCVGGILEEQDVAIAAGATEAAIIVEVQTR